MTAANLKSLYTLVPGFARDKDEDWIRYLPQADQIYLRKSRGQFLRLKDSLDELKSDLKEYNTGTARHKQIAQQIFSLTKEVDNEIKSVLPRIPTLKAKGIKARDDAIRRDLEEPTRKRHAADLDKDSYGDLASAFDVFLPSYMMPTVAPEQPEPEVEESVPTRKTQQSPERATGQPERDTYFDGVADSDIAIMKKLRPTVETFNCKDRVLEALRRFRERDERLETLKDIKAMAKK